MTNTKSSIIWFLLLVPILWLFLFRATSGYQYDSDFGRDLYDMTSIAQGDLRLLGPKLSFGGIHTGPYYYYLFAPLLVFFPTQPEIIVQANAVFAWAMLVIGFFVLLKDWRASKFSALLATYFFALIPAVLFSARQPGNAFTHQAFSISLLLLLPRLLRTKSIFGWLGYGLAIGISLNFHLVGAVVFAPLLVLLCISQLHQHLILGIKRTLVLFFGLVAAFSPVVLFDLTHQFVQFKNTFIDQSYSAFLQNSNLPSPMTTDSNLLTNFMLLQQYLTQWLGLPYILILLLTLALAFSQRHRLTTGARLLVLTLPISTALFTILARSQLAIHYLFPLVLLTAVTFLVIMLALPQKLSKVVILGLIIYTLFHFPKVWYQTTARQISEYRQFVNLLTTTRVSEYLLPGQFSIYVTRETPLAPLGWEYRYFLLAKGIKQLDASLFSQSKYLVWIAEDPNIDFAHTVSWELDQFGPRQEILKENMGKRTVIVFGHE